MSRIARAGCASENACNWTRMSGDASTRIQLAPSALTAMDDCVRARALMCPRRKPSQLRQLQFHCGKPPPAAEPSTRILTVLLAGGKSPEMGRIGRMGTGTRPWWQRHLRIAWSSNCSLLSAGRGRCRRRRFSRLPCGWPCWYRPGWWRPAHRGRRRIPRLFAGR